MTRPDDRGPREHRRRESDTHRKRHERRKPGDHGTASASEGSGSRPKHTLSINALAELNEMNARGHIPEPSQTRKPERKRRKDQPRRHEYEIVDTEYESPRRERARTYEARNPDREHDSPRKTRRRQNEYSESEREPESPRRPRRTRAYAQPDFDDDYEESDNVEQEIKRHRRKKKRIVSGAIVEEGRSTPEIRGGVGSKHSSYNSIEHEKSTHYKPPRWNRKKKKWIIAGVGLIVIIIIIVVAVVVSKKNTSKASKGSGIGNVDPDSVPTAARGSYLDPFTWYDTTDLNVTYTNETVGDLPVMGLFTDWDDSAAANKQVPALNKAWGDYATKPARGVNLGGWLSLEPFITPSLFDYDIRLGIVDEWTLCKHLGPKTTASTLEKHYATFVTEQTFKEMRDAGLDHVRIPYSYWAVQTYDDDPYLFRISWRYLLRGIEWARKYGLRVNLDLHGLPGSQNGWNHSGRLGAIGWLNGTNGELNAQRSLDVHDRLSKFFAQDRYKNIIMFYGLANEPRMVELSASAVVSWTEEAFKLIRGNGLTWAKVVFGDGFMGLANWQGLLTGYPDLILDVHQYVIFNNDLIKFTHQKKISYACDDWTEQAEQSLDTSTGYGPTMFAEWSQADTDCAEYLTNVGWGNRWTGTYDSGNSSTEALTPMCPTTDASCSCDDANASSGDYSDSYKQFLLMFAEAQMTSFEKGYGWWYWTWDTESSPQWSYRQGLAAGILPAQAYNRSFNCDSEVPDFGGTGLAETY
ncbi:glycoside hydrolase family 5 protein [Ustulina deusta]|nr:glycoside hydrolase family 5 protein [Ustulina deusta]KAI3335670.1 glycoside hydrolase family 5 protein [Ustulina deusta]